MPLRRDRLRELLDVVLDGTGRPTPGVAADDDFDAARTLHRMAGDAFTSPFHFSRLLSRGTGEPPVAMRRRVLLERAAWQVAHGASVTDAAWASGYESVDGFSRAFGRAFGHPPSVQASGYRLPAPNGIHFHPPTSLWITSEEQAMNPLTEQLVAQDLDDTRVLLERSSALPDDAFRARSAPGNTVVWWEGPEESIADLLERVVRSKETWLASIDGHDAPDRATGDDPARLLERHEAVAVRWLAFVRDTDQRGAWDDRLVDALCEPPESFQLASVVAHVLTFSAHRRLLVRQLLRDAGHVVDNGDPIEWLRMRRGEAEVPVLPESTRRQERRS